MNFAHIIAVGSLVRDPEVKTLSTGTKITNFSIGVPTDNKDASGNYVSDFYSCAVFGNLGDYVTTHCQKGTRVQVIGNLSHNKYNKKDGTSAVDNHIVANGVVALARKKGEATEAAPAASARPAKAAPVAPSEPIEPADEDIPW